MDGREVAVHDLDSAGGEPGGEIAHPRLNLTGPDGSDRTIPEYQSEHVVIEVRPHLHSCRRSVNLDRAPPGCYCLEALAACGGVNVRPPDKVTPYAVEPMFRIHLPVKDDSSFPTVVLTPPSVPTTVSFLDVGHPRAPLRSNESLLPDVTLHRHGPTLCSLSHRTRSSGMKRTKRPTLTYGIRRSKTIRRICRGLVERRRATSSMSSNAVRSRSLFALRTLVPPGCWRTASGGLPSDSVPKVLS